MSVGLPDLLTNNKPKSRELITGAAKLWLSGWRQLHSSLHLVCNDIKLKHCKHWFDAFFFYSLLGKFVSTVKDVFVSRKYHSRIPIISFVRCQIPIAICFNFSRVFLHLCMTHTDRWWSIKKGRERDGGQKRAEREHGWALLPERQNRDLGVNSLLGGLHINTFNMQVEIWVCRGK